MQLSLGRAKMPAACALVACVSSFFRLAGGLQLSEVQSECWFAARKVGEGLPLPRALLVFALRQKPRFQRSRMAGRGWHVGGLGKRAEGGGQTCAQSAD